MTKQSKNDLQAIATKYINQTNCNIFLTGKAGTGKTTFLKNITQNTYKNCIVAAPTGVAAINAGGVTLHSLFQLPFGAFVPSNNTLSQSNYTVQVNTPQSLVSGFQMNKTKRNLLREMELLIIDEASMLRSDLLDAIDTILRFVRKQHNKVFGGVQVLFIGDLLQLPPVVKNAEKEFLSPYYSSPFFFDAHALKKSKLIYVELEKIYRQSDEQFISLLNNLRNNKITNDDIQLLNTYCIPDFKPKKNEGFINLTTHNQKADEINKLALQKIKKPSFFYAAEIVNDFKDNQYPLDEMLELKEGAQVMFMKNDYSGEQRYFNGKIGTISQLDDEGIIVSFNDGSPPTEVEKYTWENKKFNLNKESNEIEEKVVGTFSHYPLKLAWAITVHKSQGLTFDKAIIDVSKAFAPGQIYVALSRLTSLDGLVLTAPINTNALFSERSLSDFVKNQEKPNKLDSLLSNETKNYAIETALNAFNFNWLDNALGFHIKTYDKDEKKSKKQNYKEWAIHLHNEFKPIKETADKFIKQIRNISYNLKEDNILVLYERVNAAQKYFEPLLKRISKIILEHLETLSELKKIKAYTNEVKELELIVYSHLQKINKCSFLISSILDNTEISKESLQKTDLYIEREAIVSEKKKPKKKKKEKKVNTKDVSYNYFLEGKSIEEIAEIRKLSTRTIEGHLAFYVEEGKIKVTRFVSEEKVDEILYTAKELKTEKLSLIKKALGEDFSYSEIKFALASTFQ
jgi:PIF1-like helicase/Helix-turn-helix domain